MGLRGSHLHITGSVGKQRSEVSESFLCYEIVGSLCFHISRPQNRRRN
jgi:hypothetical protein